ncbi:uncharacterized protein LOC112687459 [Sipha flava]|uniref:Uncharacterized protein LOC112687459 n=1 Tax=Sipha flava TaxID=143950 RepID=A0A8B8G038_9HEMI|nr:uncharacterized protein LOC112687459 [Sipha flava]
MINFKAVTNDPKQKKITFGSDRSNKVPIDDCVTQQKQQSCSVETEENNPLMYSTAKEQIEQNNEEFFLNWDINDKMESEVKNHLEAFMLMSIEKGILDAIDFKEILKIVKNSSSLMNQMLSL